MTLSKIDQLAGHVASKIAILAPEDGQELSMYQKMWLSQLRRAAVKPVGGDPATWDFIFGDMPEDLVGWGDSPSFAEETCHHVLGLYARHQQSKDSSMHDPHVGLGQAVAELILESDGQSVSEGSIRKRFNILSASTSVDAMVTHLRHLVSMLRAKEIPLDYVRLAKDIYLFHFIDQRDSVRLRWARDLYRTRRIDQRKKDAQD